MLTKERVRGAEAVLEILPRRLSREISGLTSSRSGGLSVLREIRIRAGGRASVRLGNLYFPLFSSATAREVEDILGKICEGGVYAFRDRISSGFIPFGGGIRVGVTGTARYECGSFVGAENISSLVFRIPTSECDISSELLSAFLTAKTGMLIYSPPGGGKTTALRSLAASVGGGKNPKRVCVIDEREEFLCDDYKECEVDILKGYKKHTGLEIAIRSMSPDAVIIDEIGSDEAAGIANATRAGIPVIATVHAKSLEEVRSKISLKPLFDVGAFDVFAGISEEGERHILTVDKNE